jgi:pyruvate/2-oxoglutarate dehydrogenase complex dihydrolipoamide acyltransferase (E2) component
MAEVTMPRLSDTMSEGTVGRWLKKPGDAIADGEIIAEIETDKATMDLQAFESGTLQKILVGEGQTVPIGEPIAIIGDGAAPAEPATEEQKAEASAPATGAQQAPAEERGAEAVARTTAESQAEVRQAPAAPPRRWRGVWPRSAASICARCRAPAPVGGSSKRTSKASSPARRLRHPHPRQRPRSPRHSRPPPQQRPPARPFP